MEENNLEHRMTEVEVTVSNQNRRLEDIEKRQDDLDKIASCVNTLSVNQKYMDGDIKEIKSDVKSLTEKPAKRWDSVIELIIGGVVGAFVAWVISGTPGV